MFGKAGAITKFAFASVILVISSYFSFVESSQIPPNSDTIKSRSWFDNLNPGAPLPTPKIVEMHGYPIEIHETTTADGYILELHRIPRGKNNSFATKRRTPVLLHHGNFCDSSIWVLNDPDKNLVYQLADLGYDAWMVNARGTMYSRKHKTLSVRENDFYKFTVGDLGKYDIPAEIDYILQVSGYQKLIFIGHSLAGPIFHIAMSERPEYNKKISLMTGIGTAVNSDPFSPFGRMTLGIAPYLKIFLDLISAGIGEFPPLWITKLIRMYGQEGCTNSGTARMFCQNIMFMIVGFNPSQTLLKNIPNVLSHIPSHSSTLVVDHVLQMVKTQKFQDYDWGKSKNLEIYGTPKPPLFYINRTTMPVAYYYGKNDFLVTPKDVFRTVKEIPNLILLHRISDRMFNHLDFFIAKNVNEVLNRHIIQLFQHF